MNCSHSVNIFLPYASGALYLHYKVKNILLYEKLNDNICSSNLLLYTLWFKNNSHLFLNKSVKTEPILNNFLNTEY